MTDNEIRLISNELKQVLKSDSIDYVGILKCTTNILEGVFGNDYYFPINVDEIAEKLNIVVFKQPLFHTEGKELLHAKSVKKVTIVEKKLQSFCLVDNTRNTFLEDTRFALAHEIAINLLHFGEEEYTNDCYVTVPYVYNSKEKVIANIFARFLMAPYLISKREFGCYMDEEVNLSDTKYEDWCYYFGRVAEIPYMQSAIVWEEIRMLEVLLH